LNSIPGVHRISPQANWSVITDEADARLAFYLPFPADQPDMPPSYPEMLWIRRLSVFIRVYNSLRMSLFLFHQLSPS